MKASEIVENFVTSNIDLHLSMVRTEHGYLGVYPNPFHLEGSVWTHTMMVLNEAKNDKAPEWMLQAALLHDIGKTKTYQDQEDHRRSFRNHEAISMFMANDILANDIITNPMKNRILRVIAQHGNFYNFFVDGRIPEENFSKMRSRFGFETLKDLLTFYKYDHNGRFHTDAFNVDFDIWEILAGEYPNLTSKNAEITIMIGLPRSGKDTFVNAELGGHTVISRDNIVMKYPGNTYSDKWNNLSKDDQKAINQELQRRFNAATKAKENIVINMTNMSKKVRRKWLNFKGSKDYLKRAVVVPTSVDVCASRNNQEKNIPEDVIESFARRFYFPDYEEFDEIQMV